MTDKVQKIKECMFTKDYYTDEDRKSLCDGCKEECKFNKKEYSVNNGLDLGCGVIWRDEEPVSEDLEEAAQEYTEKGSKCQEELDAFKAGANWQKQQFEKNRLKHCNSITNEQAELEQGFIDQHLDKYNRMPTYLDAIEYGMNLQKQQMDEYLKDMSNEIDLIDD